MADTDAGGVTAAQLAQICEIDPQVVRYHCRAGLLRAAAFKLGRDWFIPTEQAAAFAAQYKPYVSLSRDQRQDAGAPEGAPAS